ncbi:MAG: type II CRISPR RNA-guided endonuclease Cas9, partial [Erysipelotrichaceae bacterium]
MMYIINNAFDHNGEKIDFVSNKYLRLLKENDGVLDINLLIDDGKPVIPVSRPTIRALNEAFKIYNAVIDTYGVPKRIVIETAGGKDSIKDHTVVDEKGEKRFTKIESLYNHLIKQIDECKIDDAFLNGVHTDDIDEIKKQFEKNKDKIELYVRQNGIDLLTGKPIKLTNLNEYEIDHILPRGFQDDSMNDKMLISKLANAKKSNRLPIEFLESPDAKDFTTMTVSRFEKIVNGLFDMDLISENKRNRLLMVNSKDVEKFVKQNLVDTRYIISEFMSAVNAYNNINNYDSKIVALKGAFTSTFRKAFYIEKDRELGNQHHAIDAAMLCVTDACLSSYFPHYDERGDFEAYSNFIKETIRNEENNNDNTKEKDKNRNTISCAYYKAYGHNFRRENSLINQIKNTVPLYSHKVEKNWKGTLTEATLHEPLPENDKSALSIIGMNNNMRSFSGVNCVAVDFYKIKTTKGKTQHVSIHIPYSIVDSNGLIMKDKYIKLIKEYYCIPELLDESGNLKENLFRFRAFKNDIIYDTCTNIPQLFNIGSIALKKLELKQILNFSYNSIYAAASEMAYLLSKRFDIKFGKNEGTPFKEVSVNDLIEYSVENLFELKNFPNFEKTLKTRLKDEKNLISFSRKFVYLATIANKNNVPPTIDGQYLPTANNNTIKGNADAEYVKIKYDILGVRFGESVKGNLIINSAHGTCGKYTKVKREKFDWKISKYVVE